MQCVRGYLSKLSGRDSFVTFDDKNVEYYDDKISHAAATDRCGTAIELVSPSLTKLSATCSQLWCPKALFKASIECVLLERCLRFALHLCTTDNCPHASTGYTE
jgi:hypothetical protein